MNERTQQLAAQEQAALYALGALAPAEVKNFRAQLSADAELEFETEAYETVVNELAMSASAVTPSPGLREQLMARIAVTPQENAAKAQAPLEATAFVTRLDRKSVV